MSVEQICLLKGMIYKCATCGDPMVEALVNIYAQELMTTDKLKGLQDHKLNDGDRVWCLKCGQEPPGEYHFNMPTSWTLSVDQAN